MKRRGNFRMTWTMVLWQSQAQRALDELFQLALIPVELTVYKVGALIDRDDTYEVTFFNAQLRSLVLSCRATQDFREAFRVAILRETRGRQSHLLAGWSIWNERNEVSSSLRPVGFVASPA